MCFSEIYWIQILWRHHMYCHIIEVTIILISFESWLLSKWNLVNYSNPQVLYCMRNISVLVQCWKDWEPVPGPLQLTLLWKFLAHSCLWDGFTWISSEPCTNFPRKKLTQNLHIQKSLLLTGAIFHSEIHPGMYLSAGEMWVTFLSVRIWDEREIFTNENRKLYPTS